MRWATLMSMVFMFLGAAACAQSEANTNGPDTKACAALAGARKHPWSVNSAEFIHSPFTVTIKGGHDTGKTVTVSVPFCRITGMVKPTRESDIRFEVWLPPRADWNGKFEGVGSGASLGNIQYRSLMRGVMRGYATVATDNGHQSGDDPFDWSWALGHPPRIVDFGYRAEHTATLAGKALTRRFYGRAPQHSYFVGCSQGGHHAFMEAERFPEDYDGIVAGAPAYSWTGEMTGQAWNAHVLSQTSEGALPPQKLQLLYQAVAKACAGVDGLIDDPRQCSFDPGVIECKSNDQSSCLTHEQAVAVSKMYEGPKSSSGAQVYPGLMRGGESEWDRLWSDPKKLGGSGLSFYHFVVSKSIEWKPSMLNFDRDPAAARRKLSDSLDADRPDLSRFAERGGKIIVYHGWADDMVPSQVSTDFYASVEKQIGNARRENFYRLFMVPGMGHCGGGPGANVLFRSEQAAAVPLDPNRDMLTALEQWVEHGRAPSSFVASRLNKEGAVERTRLVCAYPHLAKYRGTGDVSSADNWACSSEPAPHLHPGPAGK
jgi:feruloyl esterase